MTQALGNWLPAVVQMAVIFGLSSIPDLNALPSGVSDHAAHFVAYALLGGFLLRGVALGTWSGVTPHAAVVAWGGSVVYGATDEFHQMFVHGRTAALDDLLADGLGAAAAVAVIAVAAAGLGPDREV